MDELRVWIYHELPSGKYAFDSRWLFKFERPDTARLNELVFKAMPCIREFRQQYGIDDENTYASPCSFEVIRLLLGAAVRELLCQADLSARRGLRLSETTH